MASNDRGTTIVEFALILPIFLALVFGIFEFGFRINQLNSIRTASAEGARAAAVGAWGTDSSCTSSGLPGNASTNKIICMTKARSGLDESKTRVKVLLPGGYLAGEDVIICIQYQLESITGFTKIIPAGDVAFAKAPARLDRLDDTNPLAAGEEAPLSGDWSQCNNAPST